MIQSETGDRVSKGSAVGPKLIFRGTLFCCGVSLVLVAGLLTWHFIDKNRIEDQARKKAQTESLNVAADIGKGLAELQMLAESLAEELSIGSLKDDHEIPDRLSRELEQRSEVGAITVAYSPQFVPVAKRNGDKPLSAPYVEREDGKPVLKEILYDYTLPNGSAEGGLGRPDTDWYRLPFDRNEVAWGEPYFGAQSGKHWAGVGAPFYRYDAAGGGKQTAGIVDVSRTLSAFQETVAEVFNEEGEIGIGYGFILSQSGQFISHPLNKYLTGPKGAESVSILIADLDAEKLNAMWENNPAPGKPLIFPYDDVKSGTESWVFITKVQPANWWVGTVLDKHHFRSSDVLRRLRRQQIGAGMASLAFLVFLTALVVRANGGSSLSLWSVSATFSVLCLAAISYLWFLNITGSSVRDELAGTADVELLDPAASEDVIADYDRQIADKMPGDSHGEKPLHIPTGAFIQSVEFSSANNVTVTGYIWQKYPGEFQDDPEQNELLNRIMPSPPQAGFDLNPGFILPEADSITVSEAYRHPLPNGGTVIGWNFRTVLRQRFDYSKYPFDRAEVWLRMWHKNFDQNVLLTPDLASYPVTDPISLPGIEAHDFVLEGWELTASFFSYRQNRYNTDYGIPDFAGVNVSPELYFNVALKRQFINIFISNLIPIIVVALLLFCVLLTMTTRPEGVSLFGFSTSAVLSFCAALFFVVIISDVNLRTNLSAQGIIYLELFYFLMYGAIMGVAVNAIIIASPRTVGIIHYRDNFLVRLTYWPLLLGILLLITLLTFA